MLITQDTLRHRFEYNPETGILSYRHDFNNMRSGDIAGTVDKHGHIVVSINKKMHMAHRLIWMYMTGEYPSVDIDHIDNVPGNNAWNNLRLATKTQNQGNKRLQVNNTTGYKGVSRYNHGDKFRAYINREHRFIHLGIFDTVEEAAAAYQRAATEYFGEFAKF